MIVWCPWCVASMVTETHQRPAVRSKRVRPEKKREKPRLLRPQRSPRTRRKTDNDERRGQGETVTK